MPIKESVLIEGTPIEAGAQIFLRLCMPAIREACTSLNATPEQLTQFYCGFLQSCLGSMAADFGQERAAKVAQVMVDTFRILDLGNEATTKH